MTSSKSTDVLDLIISVFYQWRQLCTHNFCQYERRRIAQTLVLKNWL